MTNTFRITQKIISETELAFALDKYADWGILHLYDEDSREEVEKNSEKFLTENQLKGIYIKNRSDKNRPHTELLVGEDSPEEFIVIENDNKFIIKPKSHMDVGLFLDHRISREIIGQYSRDKKVLNLFAYTGSFSVYANSGGAKNTVTVDLSKTYCEWATENFKLNEIPSDKYEVWQMDIFAYIELARKSNEKFDLIVVDPPTFSRNDKGDIWKVQENHTQLLKTLQEKLLNESGILFFSTNYSAFRLDRYIATGADKLTKKTIPAEFKPYKPHQSYAFYN